MKLTDICIERPVFATVLSLVLIVFGVIGYNALQLRYFPKIQQAIAQVSVYYPGAGPQLMKNDVTHYLENALVNVDNLTEMRSTSQYHHTHIYLTFQDGTNMIKAMGQVRDKVSSVRDKLPTDINAPVISSGGVDQPVLDVAFKDTTLSAAKIRDYVTREVQPLLQNLPGMGAIWLYGASTYAMRIWLNPQKMAALNVTVTDVENTLNSNNIDFSGGQIQGQNRKYSIVANTRLHSAKQFKEMIVRDDNGNIVRMKDIATVALGSSSLEDSPMRINGKNGITMEVRPLDSANPIEVAKEAKAELARIEKHLPEGMTANVAYNRADYLKAAINESFETLLIAIGLVILVVFLFLGSLRAALVPIITIPVCVVAVFGVMLLFGFSINVMTLLAIILAIGLVVDDAIVMLENIHRYIEKKGMAPMKAAFVGSREIAFSVIAMTLTLAAVYAPSGFASGFSASVFRQFAFTLAGAVLISGFVALTLSPMMCARILHSSKKISRLEHWVDVVFTRLNASYHRLLTFVLDKRVWVIVALIIIGILGYFIYRSVPQDFIPKEDTGYFEVNITSPPGSTVDYTDSYMKRFEKVYAAEPNIQTYISFINAGSAINFIVAKPWEQRTQGTQQILDMVVAKLNTIPGVLVSADLPDPVSYGDQTSGKPMQVRVMTTTGNYVDLQRTVDKVMRTLKAYPGVRSVTTNLKFDNQVYQVNFKRNQAAAMGVSLQDVADTISTLFSGQHITDIQLNGQNYDVRVQMQMKDLSTFDSLDKIYVRSQNAPVVTSSSSSAASSGAMVPLSNLVSLTKSVRQNNLYRYDRMDSADISADLSPGYSLGPVVQHVRGVMQKLVPDGQSFAFGARIQAFIKSNSIMLALFGLSVIFIYLVLAAQFESFVDPFIILLTVPLCIVGALFTLKCAGGTINLYTNIGLITLVGLITKHGILITQFANQRLKEGETLYNAVTKAAVVRLRPILMTTFAMVLGSIPLALATGPGANSHSQIGWVIVGGMMFGTFFSLLVVPVAYYYLAPFDHKKRKMLAQLKSV